MRAQFVLSEVGLGLRRNLTMTLAVVVTVAVSLVFLGAALLLNKQVDVLKGYWYDKVEVSLFLCGEGSARPTCAAGPVTPDERGRVEAELRALPEVDTVYYESKQEAYSRFRQAFADRAIADSVTAEAMPESFRVKLHDPRRYHLIRATFASRPGVESVQDERRVLERLFSALNWLRRIALAVALANLVGAVLMIVNTIRLAAFNRRRETGIMKLVGASNRSIQLPFVLEAAVAGLVGALLACVALILLQRFFVLGTLAQNLPSFPFVGWSHLWATLPLLVAAGVTLAALASFLTLYRYLRV